MFTSKDLKKLIIPLIFEQLLAVSVGFVDTFMVSIAGEAAVSGVALVDNISNLLIQILSALATGGAVVCSQYLGSRNINMSKKSAGQLIFIMSTLSSLLMVISLIGNHGIINFIFGKIEKDVFESASIYFYITAISYPFLGVYNAGAALFRSIGNSKISMNTSLIMNIINICGNALFIFVFDMGVAGVAWATFLCQGVSCVLSLWVVARRVRAVPSEGERVWFSWKMLGQIAVVAIPSILQQSFVSVGNIIIQSVVNSFGASVIAGFAAATKLNNVLISSLTTLGSGISNYASQNLGAGKNERVKAGFGAGVRLLGSICLCFTALYLLAGRQLLMLFMNSPTGEAINTGLTFLQTIAPFYLLLAFKLTSDGLMRGCGMMGRFMATTLSDLFLRVVLAMLFSRWLGVNGTWLSWPVGWFVGTVLSMVFYRTSIYRQAEEKTTL